MPHNLSQVPLFPLLFLLPPPTFFFLKYVLFARRFACLFVRTMLYFIWVWILQTFLLLYFIRFGFSLFCLCFIACWFSFSLEPACEGSNWLCILSWQFVVLWASEGGISLCQGKVFTFLDMVHTSWIGFLLVGDKGQAKVRSLPMNDFVKVST